MRNLLFILVLIALSSSGCVFDQDDHKLVLCNHSMDTSYFYALTDTTLTMKYVTFLPRTPYLTVTPGDSGYPLFARKGENWAYKINTICQDSLLRLFIFDADTTRKYGWENIIKLKKYFRFDLSVKELDSLHWHVTYTGLRKKTSEL